MEGVRTAVEGRRPADDSGGESSADLSSATNDSDCADAPSQPPETEPTVTPPISTTTQDAMDTSTPDGVDTTTPAKGG